MEWRESMVVGHKKTPRTDSGQEATSSGHLQRDLPHVPLDTAPFGNGFGAATSSSPWERLWKGDEDVAAPFQKREHGFIAIFMDTEGNVVGLHSLK